jgi:hypothetical protein
MLVSDPIKGTMTVIGLTLAIGVDRTDKGPASEQASTTDGYGTLSCVGAELHVCES